MKKLLNLLKSNPKKIFLFDGIGALVSAIFLGIVLIKLQHLIGMPKPVLYKLAGLASILCVSSLYCYFFLKSNWKPFLKLIAFGNIFHCLITILFLFIHSQSIATLGFVYFINEMIIIIPLALFELKMANRNY